MDRIATFRSFISKSPSDPFPRYGLAMEHKGRGELAEAWAVFEELLGKFPDYVPTYLMAGGTLVALGRKDEAADTIARASKLPPRRGDQHARGELEAALARDLTRLEPKEIPTMKIMVAMFVMAVALMAAAASKKANTTPTTRRGHATETKSDGSSTGGTTYGGATTTPAGGGADPCAGMYDAQ